MNIKSFSSENSDFRNRFGGRRKSQTKWAIAEQTASDAANFFRGSFGPFRWNQSAPAPYEEDLKKKTFGNNVRYYAVYLGCFLLAMAIIAIYYFSDLSSSSKESVQNDAFDLPPGFGVFNHHVNHHQGSWRKKIFDIRPNDVINHKYDEYAISIMLADDPVKNDFLHTSFKTFLRQINRIQICTETTANAFIGGNHHTDVSFTPKSIVFPKLERYIDGFLSMNVFSPHQSWYMQVDEGTLLVLVFLIASLRFLLVYGKYLYLFRKVSEQGSSFFP